MRRTLLLAALVAALAGCGGGGGGAAEATQAEETTAGGGAAAQTLTVNADPSGALRFDTNSLEANVGEVELVMDNPSSVEHNIALKGNGVDETGEIVGKGEQSRVSATVEPGTYTFYCSVPGHEAAGMRGELTVS